jgi:YHS domain-containing protein
MTKDLVCGMQVDEYQAAAAGLTSEHRGQMFYFCSDQCKRQFDDNPHGSIIQCVPDPKPGLQTAENYLG